VPLVQQIVRQVLNTAQRGDTVELGLLVEQDASSSPGVGVSSSKLDFVPIDDVLNATLPDDKGPLKCIIRISHKYALSKSHQEKNHPRDVVPTEIRPKLTFDTLFLRRILQQIDGELISDLPPPELFTSGRTCDLRIAFQRLPAPSSTPVAELTEEIEPSLEQLASFGESLKGKRVILYACADGSFAHHLTVYLTAWGMDVTHVSPESQVDGMADPPTPAPYEPRSSYSPSLGPYSEPGFSFGASGKTDPTQARSQPPSFIFIDDDIDILKERLQSLRPSQPQPAVSFASRRRPSLSHHRPRSSSQVARLMGLNAQKQSARVIIMHFTSLGNYKLLKDVMQSIMASYATSTSLVPEVMIIPKPAGPRRFLTALHTAVTKPNVDPFFLPIATSPASPAAPLSTGTSFIGSPANEHDPSTYANNGGSPQTLSPSTKINNRPHGSRTNSDRSTRSGDSVNKSFANVLPSPLALPDNVEYFSSATQRLGFSPSSGLVIQSPDGQPAGIYFHPRSKTSRTASSQSMERDRGQLSVPTPRRASTSRMASGGRKDDYLKVSSFKLPMVDNENEMSPSSSSPTVPGRQLSTTSILSQEIQPQSSSILSPVPRKPSNVSRKNSSPSTSPAEGSRHGLGRRPSAESKGSMTPPAPSKQKGKVLASDTNVVPPISVLIVDGMLFFD
jgi:osomolarity two-component system response regulator SSK1